MSPAQEVVRWIGWPSSILDAVVGGCSLVEASVWIVLDELFEKLVEWSVGFESGAELRHVVWVCGENEGAQALGHHDQVSVNDI